MDNGQKENSNSFISFFRRLPEYVRVCLTSTFLFGLLAHGIALVNKFAVMDELHYSFHVGSTVASGRWFLEILGSFVRWLFGSPNFSLPLTGGLLTIFFTALCSCVLVSWLGLERQRSWVLISGITAVFPVMSGLFFYCFTAPYYMFGLLLILLGGRLLCTRRRAATFLGSVCLVCLGLSIYQAFLPLFLSLLLVFFLKELVQKACWTLPELLKEIGWYCLGCVFIAAVYLISVRLSTHLSGTGLTDYKGISTMGATSIPEYLHRIKLAYYLFLLPARADRYAFVFPYRLLTCYRLTLIGIGLLGGGQIIRLLRQSPLQGISGLLVFACFPMAVNFIYLLCAQEDVYNLMLFGLLAPFFLLICLTDWPLPIGNTTPAKLLQKASVVLLAVFCLFSIRMDNAVYTRGIFVQERTKSYFTSMIAQIKSTPGYTGTTPVAFVGDIYAYMDPTFHGIEGFSAISIAPLPYDSSPFSIGYSWQDFLNLWCGFCPPTADPEAFEALPEVQAMPCYPDSGSIRMVNGVLVVKLLSNEQTRFIGQN